MKKILIMSVAAAMMFPAMTAAQHRDDFHWSRTIMDGSRTGVTPPASDVGAALGTVKGRKYTAPSGRAFKGGAIVKVAGTVIAAQTEMAPVKEVIASSPESMESAYPESPLSNWFADNLIRAAEEITGRKTDMSVGNFGGIRVDMPQGDVTVDDIRSMFPFKNDLVYLVLKGSDVRAVLEQMAEDGFQVLGGVRAVARDGKLISAEIGGKPLDDNATYGVATISFLLNGGDGFHLSRNAVEVVDTGVEIFDAIMGLVRKDTEEGRKITGQKDGRVVILD